MTRDDTNDVEPGRVRAKFDMIMPETLYYAVCTEAARRCMSKAALVREMLFERYPDHAGVKP